MTANSKRSEPVNEQAQLYAAICANPAANSSRVHPEEEAFRRAIEANPEEMTTRLVFADWLQERDDPRADGWRATVALGTVAWWFCGDETQCWGWWRYSGHDSVVARHLKESRLPFGAVLPGDWFDSVPRSRHVIQSSHDVLHTPALNLRYGPHVLLKAAVAGFLRLPVDRQQALLRGER